jgi:hypothetical protein
VKSETLNANIDYDTGTIIQQLTALNGCTQNNHPDEGMASERSTAAKMHPYIFSQQ